jgi:hypothetical protein
MITIYASIGNSDDKLSQCDWADYAEQFVDAITQACEQIYGVWFSESSSPFQNACVCFETGSRAAAEELQAKLTELREQFDQDSIAWAEVPETQFI